MIPLRSPYGLLQEDLWPNEWLIFVSCIMLNCTSRKQVEKVLPQFIKSWPAPEKFLRSNLEEVQTLIAPLGFKTRRTKNLFAMTHAYLKEWKHPKELPGIGEYGSRCWEIICKNDYGSCPPVDHALVRYHEWCTKSIKYDKLHHAKRTKKEKTVIKSQKV